MLSFNGGACNDCCTNLPLTYLLHYYNPLSQFVSVFLNWVRYLNLIHNPIRQIFLKSIALSLNITRKLDSIS